MSVELAFPFLLHPQSLQPLSHQLSRFQLSVQPRLDQKEKYARHHTKCGVVVELSQGFDEESPSSELDSSFLHDFSSLGRLFLKFR